MIDDVIRKLAKETNPSRLIKHDLSAQVAADVEAFLRAGGQIEQLPGPGQPEARESTRIEWWADYETNTKRAKSEGVTLER